ncbi:hypothetical protein JHK87_018319 [Glycine soja]|nr:hypothetical protein JHK87_018319 [Glycine soja]
MYLGLDALKEVIENTKLYPIRGLFNFKYYFDEIDAYDHRTLGYDVGITTRWNNPNDLYNPLMKFQLPKQDDGFDYYRNSSQDESRDNQGGGITNHSNGNVHEKEVNLFKKRRWSLNSDNKEKSSFYGAHMMEEQYRSMLGEHIQKYKRRFMGALSSPVQNQAIAPLVKSNIVEEDYMWQRVASNSTHKFSLKMPDVDLNSSISEGVGGIIRLSILSKGGVLQVYYVKVLEKGDTYEIIEKSLPKKQKVKKDPALIEKEEMERCGIVHHFQTMAELKNEALKVAQEAVSKQRMLTSAFDTECLSLRQAGEIDPLPPNVVGASNIDLQTPSTMLVASTVRTPELFKGVLKEYKPKDKMGLGKTIQAMAFLAHLAEEKNIWGPFLVVAPTSVLNNWNEELERFCPELKRLPYQGGLSERTLLRKSINLKDLYRR